MNDAEFTLQRTIATISQSDPLIKLLEQIRLGRMTRTDAGLRAITESWLTAYQKAVETPGLTRQALLRLDPSPRVTELVHEGILTHDHIAVNALLAAFKQAVERATA